MLQSLRENSLRLLSAKDEKEVPAGVQMQTQSGKRRSYFPITIVDKFRSYRSASPFKNEV